jgi:hypothetical protein
MISDTARVRVGFLEKVPQGFWFWFWFWVRFLFL